MEEQTYRKVQEHGEQQARHVQDTHPFETSYHHHGKKAGVVQGRHRSGETRTAKPRDFSSTRLFRLHIKEELNHGEHIPHRQQWVRKLPLFPFYGNRRIFSNGLYVCVCLLLNVMCFLFVNREVVWAHFFSRRTSSSERSENEKNDNRSNDTTFREVRARD